MLSNLKIDDEEFFIKLSYILRLYISKRNIIPNAEKMTNDEINIKIKEVNFENIDDLSQVLNSCDKFKFSSNLYSDHDLREDLKKLAKKFFI